MTYRRWIAERWDDSTAAIAGAQAEHLARVLRAQPGMEADVVAGGRVFHSVVTSVALDGPKSEVLFQLGAELEAGPALPITLVLAVYKFDRMEWVIEKATELGVAAIAPILAQRSEKYLAQSAAKRAERWRRIAHESAQQARRSDVPLIHDPVSLADRVRAASSGASRIVLAEQERAISLRRTVEDVFASAHQESQSLGSHQFEIAIGPEGGWAPAEAALFDAHGWRATSLGPRILRAETAAIAALAIIASLLE
jgi:16S rRNA (uracil1498-N3)-methyltransferase